MPMNCAIGGDLFIGEAEGNTYRCLPGGFSQPERHGCVFACLTEAHEHGYARKDPLPVI